MSSIRDLLLYETWITLSKLAKISLAQAIETQLNGEFTFVELRTPEIEGSTGIATFVHAKSALEMQLIPGGSFCMGCSEAERGQISKIDPSLKIDDYLVTPAVHKTLDPFFLARFPFTNNLVTGRISLDPDVFRIGLSEDSKSNTTVWLTRTEAEQMCQLFDLDLPSEAQWEYACRGGTDSLFFFGEYIPTESALDDILTTDFDDPVRNKRGENQFGLVGLFSGEWCADSFFCDRTDERGDRPTDKG